MLDLILPFIGGALFWQVVLTLLPSPVRYIQRRTLNRNIDEIRGLLEDQKHKTGSAAKGEETGEESTRFLTFVVELLWRRYLSSSDRKEFLDRMRNMRDKTRIWYDSLHELDEEQPQSLIPSRITNFEELYDLLNKANQDEESIH